jgi:hypothetical protein
VAQIEPTDDRVEVSDYDVEVVLEQAGSRSDYEIGTEQAPPSDDAGAETYAEVDQANNDQVQLVLEQAIRLDAQADQTVFQDQADPVAGEVALLRIIAGCSLELAVGDGFSFLAGCALEINSGFDLIDRDDRDRSDSRDLRIEADSFENGRLGERGVPLGPRVSRFRPRSGVQNRSSLFLIKSSAFRFSTFASGMTSGSASAGVSITVLRWRSNASRFWVAVASSSAART